MKLLDISVEACFTFNFWGKHQVTFHISFADTYACFLSDQSQQSAEVTCSILFEVLKDYKRKHDHIKYAIIRSDNARCVQISWQVLNDFQPNFIWQLHFS